LGDRSAEVQRQLASGQDCARQRRDRDGFARPFAEFRAFWRQFMAKAFNPYRPELHYMRGPGPAWRAKHLNRSHRS